ncbi:EF-hand domain [Trinorchestia longiramus]|nr:EF-hand domain [Trinorchestia longiramus]
MWSRVWLLVVLVLGTVVLNCHSLELGFRRAALMARARQEAADRLRRGFQNSALATARGFGKRGGGVAIRRPSNSLEVAELFPAGTGGLDFGTRFGLLDGGHWKALEAAGGLKLREEDIKRSSDTMATNSVQGERYPVSMVGELISSSPSLATSLVSRFLDTDSDGYVSPKELVNVMQ